MCLRSLNRLAPTGEAVVICSRFRPAAEGVLHVGTVSASGTLR